MKYSTKNQNVALWNRIHVKSQRCNLCNKIVLSEFGNLQRIRKRRPLGSKHPRNFRSSKTQLILAMFDIADRHSPHFSLIKKGEKEAL